MNINMAVDQQKIETHIKNLRELLSPSGLFLASASSVTTGYDKAWLRDNFYTSMAFEYIEDWATLNKVWTALLDIFIKHESKIEWASTARPYATYQYIHARYNPETFEEFWDEWGNKQNDAIGEILFKLADLAERGHNMITTDDQKRIVQKLVNYLNSIEYWHDSDNGIWEESEEVHASSIGAVVSALKKIRNLDIVDMPSNLIENGETALQTLLPRESEAKFADLALLSLIWPFDVVDKKNANIILSNVTYHLERDNGVIRYKSDRYYNRNVDGYSEEAEWCMGLPWLAIIYAKMGEKDKANNYLTKAERALTPDKKMPELYYSHTRDYNNNTPLGWAESLYVVAQYEVDKCI